MPNDGHRFAIRSRGSIFDAAEAQGIDLSRGELVEGKFAFRFSSGARTTATVRPPNQLTCTDQYRTRVERFLRSIGVFAPDMESGFDLWRVAEGAHPAVACAAALGCSTTDIGEVDCLVPTKLLELPSQRSPGDRLRVVEGGEVGLTDDGVVEALTSEQTEGYRLDRERLIQTLAAELGLTAGRATCVSQVLDLGRRALGNRELRVFLALAAPPEATEFRHVLQLNADDHAALLVPRTRVVDSDLCVIPFERLVPPTSLLQQIAAELDIEQHIDARDRAPAGMRLVLDSHQDRAWLDGVDLDVTSGEYAFLCKVAEDLIYDRVTTTVRLEDGGAVSGSARKMKSQVIKRLELALVKNGCSAAEAKLEARRLIKSRGSNRGYRLNVSAWIG